MPPLYLYSLHLKRTKHSAFYHGQECPFHRKCGFLINEERRSAAMRFSEQIRAHSFPLLGSGGPSPHRQFLFYHQRHSYPFGNHLPKIEWLIPHTTYNNRGRPIHIKRNVQLFSRDGCAMVLNTHSRFNHVFFAMIRTCNEAVRKIHSMIEAAIPASLVRSSFGLLPVMFGHKGVPRWISLHASDLFGCC